MKKNPPKNKETRKKTNFQGGKKYGAGDCCEAAKTDKASDRDCGRG
jgi:hypothetical protein